MQKPTPMFTHDCDCCAFLGNMYAPTRPAGFVDMYRCDAHGATVIVRYGDDGPDYSSASLSRLGLLDGELAIAGRLAEQMGVTT